MEDENKFTINGIETLLCSLGHALKTSKIHMETIAELQAQVASLIEENKILRCEAFREFSDKGYTARSRELLLALERIMREYDTSGVRDF